MNILLSILIGFLFSTGIYLLLRRSLVKIILGLIIISHAANLLIFTMGRLNLSNPAIIEEGKEVLGPEGSEPLTQALILTAIVIGFGLQAFTIVLFKKTYQVLKEDDIDKLRTTDQIEIKD